MQPDQRHPEGETTLIVTVTLNPSIDRTLILPQMERGGVHHVAEVVQDPSGKGVNVSLALQAMETDSTVVGVVAGRYGESLREMLSARGFTPRLIPLPQGETRINTKIYERGDGMLTELNERGPTVDAVAIEQVAEVLRETVRDGDVVVFAGSLPPGSPVDTYLKLGRLAQGRGARVVVDTSGPALAASLGLPPFIMKPNLKEACELVGLPAHTPARRVLGRIKQLWDERLAPATGEAGRLCDALILTMGRDGAVFFTHDRIVKAAAPAASGTTAGCGDALLAATLWARQQGRSWVESARFATAAAAAAAAIIGTRFPPLADIEAQVPKVVLSDPEW